MPSCVLPGVVDDAVPLWTYPVPPFLPTCQLSLPSCPPASCCPSLLAHLPAASPSHLTCYCPCPPSLPPATAWSQVGSLALLAQSLLAGFLLSRNKMPGLVGLLSSCSYVRYRGGGGLVPACLCMSEGPAWSAYSAATATSGTGGGLRTCVCVHVPARLCACL